MAIHLYDKFNYRRLIRFVIPSIVMMVFASLYGVVDGLVVSNFVGKTAFASVNLIMPFLMVITTIGFMIGTGGSALVAKTYGEGDTEKAKRLFSFLIYTTMVLGAACSVLGIIFIRPISALLGAEGEMLEICVVYGRIILCSLTAWMLQNVFQSFCVTAEKPGFGLVIMVLAGVTNIVLDLLFVAVFKWGVVGAAVATAVSQVVGGVVPLIYFALPNKSFLRLTGCSIDLRALGKTFTNGSSELMTNLSMSLVNILYNYRLLSIYGENGVAAYGVIMYVSFIFISIFIGYSIGSAPIVSYNFGAENTTELKNIRKKSIVIILTGSVVLTALAILLSPVLSGIFVGYDEGLYELTNKAFTIYSLSFLFAGFSIFASSFFTALGDGLVSAVISFFRTFLFQVLAIILLPLIMGNDGIWWSISVAEMISIILSIFFLVRMKKKYNY
ncbi:MAG: MATE family efflux transporter [Clostridia bacterium]|nr:MATE family efflux transporter [Clostridia bacterium]